MASGKAGLLLWCKNNTQGHAHVSVENFHTSWADGMAFCALIHNFRPDVMPYSTLNPKDREKNLDLAFKTALKLGIPALLDVEDMLICSKPEPFSVMTYLSQYYHFFTTGNAKATGLGIARITADAKPAAGMAQGAGKAPVAAVAKPAADHPKCAKCNQPVSGNTFEAAGGLYHENCFGCFKCGKKLTRCVNVNNKPYCDTCGRSALVEVKRNSNTSAVNRAAAAASVVSAATSASQSKWQREKEEREKREKEEREKQEREKREREEREKRENEERSRLQREKEDRERREREENERKERLKREQEERDRQLQIQRDREKREREERERQAQLQREKEQRERDERELQNKTKREQEQIKREQEERDRQQKREREARERETREREKREQEERDIQKREQEKREREERDRQQQQQREKERLEREKREREKREQEERDKQQKRDQEKREREEHDRQAQLQREKEQREREQAQAKAKTSTASKPATTTTTTTSTLLSKQAELERERELSEQIERERREKHAKPSTPAPSDQGQSEWLQKVNKMNQRREDRRDGSTPSTPTKTTTTTTTYNKPTTTTTTYNKPSTYSNNTTTTATKTTNYSNNNDVSSGVASASVSKVAANPFLAADNKATGKETKKESKVSKRDYSIPAPIPVSSPPISDRIEMDLDNVEVTQEELDSLTSDVQMFCFEDSAENLEGYLLQKYRRKKWVKRYFIVRDGRLSGYPSKPDSAATPVAKSGSKILGKVLSQDVFIVPLETVESILPADDEECAFVIDSSAQKEKIYLRCTTSEDVGLWVSGLYHAINLLHRNPVIRETSESRKVQPFIQEGYLMQRKGKVWKKFWFALQTGFICSFQPRNKNNHNKLEMKLALYDCQIDEYEPEANDFSSFIITTQTDEEIILKADNTEDMLFWINAIIREKYLIEETINSINV